MKTQFRNNNVQGVLGRLDRRVVSHYTLEHQYMHTLGCEFKSW